jgi:hypothetical protein
MSYRSRPSDNFFHLKERDSRQSWKSVLQIVDGFEQLLDVLRFDDFADRYELLHTQRHQRLCGVEIMIAQEAFDGRLLVVYLAYR